MTGGRKLSECKDFRNSECASQREMREVREVEVRTVTICNLPFVRH